MDDSDGPWFVDFKYPADDRYPDNDRPFGVVERATRREYVARIIDLPLRVRLGFRRRRMADHAVQMRRDGGELGRRAEPRRAPGNLRRRDG